MQRTTNLLKQIFSDSEKQETINAFNNGIKQLLNALDPKKYQNNYSLGEFLPKDPNARGYYNGILSAVLTKRLLLRLSEKDSNFLDVDDTSIDYVYNNPSDSTFEEGDFKMTFKEDNKWTGNGSSNKRGNYILVRATLNQDAKSLTGNDFIKSMYVGLIPVKEEYNVRCGKVKEGKESDRSNILIPISDKNLIVDIIGKSSDKRPANAKIVEFFTENL